MGVHGYALLEGERERRSVSQPLALERAASSFYTVTDIVGIGPVLSPRSMLHRSNAEFTIWTMATICTKFSHIAVDGEALLNWLRCQENGRFPCAGPTWA